MSLGGANKVGGRVVGRERGLASSRDWSTEGAWGRLEVVVGVYFEREALFVVLRYYSANVGERYRETRATAPGEL